jgi:hypothetical protein
MANALEEFRRYGNLIGSMLAPVPPFAPTAENSASVQVERGIIFAHSMNNPANPHPEIVEPLINADCTRMGVVDRHGHVRPVYRPLLTYAWLQTFSRAYESLPRAEFGRWEESARAWCDELERSLGEFVWPEGTIPARLGSRAAEIAWNALALHVAGKVFVRDAFTDLAGDTFGHLTKRQLANGAMFERTASDNPETYWYHELVTLHAASSYAVQAEDRALAATVARATSYHAADTQPDHATNQPWALFAFIWNEHTRSRADQMLHASSTQDSSSNHVALMLLADALYCLRLFAPSEKVTV